MCYVCKVSVKIILRTGQPIMLIKRNSKQEKQLTESIEMQLLLQYEIFISDIVCLMFWMFFEEDMQGILKFTFQCKETKNE